MQIGKLKSLQDNINGALIDFKEGDSITFLTRLSFFVVTTILRFCIYYRTVKRIQKLLYGKNHLKNADLLIEVGLIQDRLGNIEMALRCFAEALRMRRKFLEKHDKDIAGALFHTGRMHQSKKEHHKSQMFFEQAIYIYCELDDDFAPQLANACRHLGLSQIACGDREKALSSLERCLELRECTYGLESEQWAEAAYDIGIAKYESGFYKEAAKLLDKFVLLQKGFDFSLVDSRSKVSNALLHLGKIYIKKRNIDSARVCLEEALEIRKKLSNNEIGLSEVLFSIGGAHEYKKQYLESLVCYEESLKLRLSVLGEDEKTADIISRIGEIRRSRGQLDLALGTIGYMQLYFFL